MDNPLVESLKRAVISAPEDVPLRLHLGRLLLEGGLTGEAIAQAAAALQVEPDSEAARALMSEALGGVPRNPAAPDEHPVADARPEASPRPTLSGSDSAPQEHDSTKRHGFDWTAAEEQVGDVAEPMFIAVDGEDLSPAFDIERSTVTLADVGGMTAVKERLNAAFLAPLKNPELRTLYGKSLRGGLLMYGPPGCGKTFIARAVAGELGANFLSVGLSDILDPMLGVSERNVHEAFQLARQQAPCVLFFDEVDAVGQRRSQTRASATRGVVNQLLTELDGIDGANEGVFVLAATNQPWDVDPALRRPGRFDRTVLVLPPDAAAREAIFRYHLTSRPVEGIDLSRLAKQTDGFSGADIAYVCELAAERALLDSVATGVARLIRMADVLAAVHEVPVSTNAWLDSARNVVMFGTDDGTYADLKSYLKNVKRL